MGKLEWDELDGGCQRAITDFGDYSAWESGCLNRPVGENTYHENISAAKNYAEFHFSNLIEKQRINNIEIKLR